MEIIRGEKHYKILGLSREESDLLFKLIIHELNSEVLKPDEIETLEKLYFDW